MANGDTTKAISKITKDDRRGKFFLYLSIFVLAVTFAGALVFGQHMTKRLDAIANRLEDSQRGYVCIFLIKPESRTVDNVTDCIEQNQRGDKSNFQFNPEGSPQAQTIPIAPTALSVASPPPVQNIKVEAHTPAPKPPKTILPTEPDPRPKPIKTLIKNPVMQVLHRVNETTGELECLFEGDTIWQISESCGGGD